MSKERTSLLIPSEENFISNKEVSDILYVWILLNGDNIDGNITINQKPRGAYKELGINYRTFYRKIDKLLEYGYIEKDGEYKYKISSKKYKYKRYVYKVVDGKAQSNPVQVTRVNGGREFIVDEGLVPGDVIVAEGVGLLREGTPVKAKAAQTPVAGVTKANQSSSAETINQSSLAEAINQSSLAETTAQSLLAETATASPATTTEN